MTVCHADFDIWDRVLARHPGMRLETLSGIVDTADGARMWELTRASANRRQLALLVLALKLLFRP